MTAVNPIRTKRDFNKIFRPQLLNKFETKDYLPTSDTMKLSSLRLNDSSFNVSIREKTSLNAVSKAFYDDFINQSQEKNHKPENSFA